MNSFVVIAFVALAASAQAGLHHGYQSAILQGPGSKTTLVGPEGSLLTAAAPGGHVIHEEHPGYIAHAAPILAHHAPIVHQSEYVIAHHVPVSHGHESGHVVVEGPSGIVATGHEHAPIVAHQAPIVAHHAPIVAHHVPITVPHHAPIVAVVAEHDVDDNGHEGQYIHDLSEALYDDGSYKPHLGYHH